MTSLGPRLPGNYIVVTGAGESSASTPSGDRYETGAYDAALLNAEHTLHHHAPGGDTYESAPVDSTHRPHDLGICNANIVLYSSIIPKESKHVAYKSTHIPFGSVLESIMAKAVGVKGQRLCAGLLLTKVFNGKNAYMGMLASEYTGRAIPDRALSTMLGAVEGMVERRGYGRPVSALEFRTKTQTETGYTVQPHTWIVSKIDKVTEKYACVLAGVSFVSFRPQQRRHNRRKRTRRRRRR